MMEIVIEFDRPTLGYPPGRHTIAAPVLAMKIARYFGLRLTPQQAAHLLVWRGLAEAALEAIGGDPANKDALYAMMVVIEDVVAEENTLDEDSRSRARAWAQALPPQRQKAILAWKPEQPPTPGGSTPQASPDESSEEVAYAF